MQRLAQVIDDSRGHTLCQASTLLKDVKAVAENGANVVRGCMQNNCEAGSPMLNAWTYIPVTGCRHSCWQENC